MFSLLILGSVFTMTQAGPGGKCRGLALAGGGDKGAYQAGVIAGLVSALPAGEAEYDVVTGVGCGALNALAFALSAPGAEAAAAASLVSFWEGSSYSDFYEDWAGGLIEGLLQQSGLYNSAPLTSTLKKLAGAGNFGRQVVIGATDLVSGDYLTFNGTLALADLLAGAAGSFSMAGVFPVTPLDDLVLMDGSIKFSVDILSAVTHCQAAGYANSDIIVDIALVAGKTINPVNAASYKTLQVLIRYLEISSYDGVMQVVENAQHDYPGVTLRNIVEPSGSMPNQADPWPYDFSSSDLKSMVQMGISDATKSVGARLAYQ